MRTLYLQRSPSLAGRNAFAGRRLFDTLSASSDESLVSFAVVDDDEAQGAHPRTRPDFLSRSQAVRFAPGLVYIEGGLFYRYGETWRWRVPRELLENFVH